MSGRPRVRFGVGVSVDTTARVFSDQEMAQRRKEAREREILVGFIMAQAKVSQDEAEHILSSGLWELSMGNLRQAMVRRQQQLETPVMLTEGGDG